MAEPDRVAEATAPSGTVTFVFTDIEGSTQRWERDRAAMQQALRLHDAVMRSAISAFGGHVFKTIGDAFCAAFGRPEDAVAAALEAQRALAAEDFAAVGGIRVRAAVHTGTADERDGDYFGPPVNRVARLLAIGHGGQVLVSGSTAALVAGTLPAGAVLIDLGEHRLRDLSRPERVHQLSATGLVAEFPRLRSLNVSTDNLPLQVTSFVGRETEIGEIGALLERNRLVTLVGPGGIGKSRVSLHVAADFADGSGDGVWLVELAPLAAAEYIPSAIAQAMGLSESFDGEPLDNLVRALQTKRTLLVFDNCEHLIEPVGLVVGAILRACPGVKVLASSRQALGLAAEVLYQVPALAMASGIALFAERARAQHNRFEVTAENAPIIEDICRRLDGIPLAIELAASRASILSPRQLRDRLDERFRVLTGGRRDALPRQQTLRALIDWSHDLLSEPERVLFRRLSIFVNGFSLEGAAAVASGEDLDEFEAMDLLASLVGKSLVLAEPDGDALRYRLLESTRAYAAERLDAAGERELLVCRHLFYVCDRFAALRTNVEATALWHHLTVPFAAELGDVRAALAGALKRDVVRGATLLGTLEASWRHLGLATEGIRLLDTFVAAVPPDESLVLANLAIALSMLLDNVAIRVRSREVARRAVECARAAGDGRTLGAALVQHAMACIRSGELDEAAVALAEADENAGSSVLLRLRILSRRAFLAHYRGDLDGAAAIYEQTLREHRALANFPGEGMAVINWAELEFARGDVGRAIELIDDFMPRLRAASEAMILYMALVGRASYLLAADGLVEAMNDVREVLDLLAPTEPDNVYVAIAIECVALALAIAGDVSRAAVLEAFADESFRRHGFSREKTEQLTGARIKDLLNVGLDSQSLERLTLRGRSLDSVAAVSLARESLDLASFSA